MKCFSLKMSGQRKTNRGMKSVGVDTSTDTVVYALAPTRSEHFVDMVLRIMDAEGPRPMRNLRPAQKNRNGADQFYASHQAEYEARCQQNDDKIGRVLTHNNACPKLYDELKKRNSTAKPALQMDKPLSSTVNFGQTCHIGPEKRIDMDHLRKLRQRNLTASSRLHETKSKVTKPSNKKKYRSLSRLYKLSKIRTNKACQCTTYYLPSESKSVAAFQESLAQSIAQQQDFIMATSPSEGNDVNVNNNNLNNNVNINNVNNNNLNNNVNNNNLNNNNLNNNVNNNNVNINNVDNNDVNTNNVNNNQQPPATTQAPKKAPTKAGSKTELPPDNTGKKEKSVPSVSSYNSYMSMDHEPMVE